MFCWLLAAMLSLALVGAQPLLAQQTSPPVSEAPTNSAAALARAKAQAMELMRAGRHSDAVTPAEQALRIAETLHGADAIETAVAAHNLGFLLRRTTRLSDAAANLERALAIYERRHPAVHEDTRNALGELGQIYQATGRAGETAAIYERLIARAAQEGHGAHLGVAHMLTNRAFVLRGLGRGDESEADFTRAIGVYEAQTAIDGEPYRLALEGLLDRLDATNRGDAAIARAKEAIARLDALGDAGSQLAMRLHNRLSKSALEAGRHADALGHARAALALHQNVAAEPDKGRNLDQTVAALNNLARAHRAVADYPAAEDAYRRAVALLDGRGDKANSGILNDNLAVLYLHQGRHDEAERYHKRALALLEEALGREHPSVGRAAGNLGALLSEVGRHAEAEPLLRRGLAILEARKSQDPVSLGIIEDNLAGLLRVTGRHTEARAHLERALELFQGALPAKHPRLATARNNLGRFLLDSGALADAEIELKRALVLAEDLYGPNSLDIAVPAANLAEVMTETKRYGEARALFDRALAALEAVHGPKHANLLVSLVAAGRLELADGKADAARALFERAVAIELAGRARSGIRGRTATADGGTGRGAFHGLIEAQWRSGATPAARDAARALEVGQWDTMTPAAIALAALGARVGAGDQALGATTRERQDLAADWTATDRRLTELLAESGQRNAGLEGQLRQRLATVETRLATIDADLAARYPRYWDLARPSALSVDAIRRLLAPEEAAIQFVVTPEATHVWLLSRSDIAWHRAPIGERNLRSLVRGLRCGLDRAEWDGAGAERCSTLLGLDPKQVPQAADPLPFDVGNAHRLYEILLGPLKSRIAGKDLLVVASGPLTALPLQVLVAEPPAAAEEKDYARAAWLGRRHAITVLPSLASLAALRGFARSRSAAKPYIGIGNPLLTGSDGTDRRAFEVPECDTRPDAPSPVAAAVQKHPASLVRNAGPEDLRRQPPLPEAADELCRVARFVGAPGDDVALGARATETEIKAMSSAGRLADARIIHFATHGLLAGETALFLAAKTEPSLLLTPPQTATELDDGLLTASEVAALKLNADWVILSACNTASGDGVGAEALSGLARAFFYAGAHSLLVSHWAVDSDATVKLITSSFEAGTREPHLTQAQALSRSMTAMIDSGGSGSHPSKWAPFIVVGGSAPAAPVDASVSANEVPPESVLTKPATKSTPKRFAPRKDRRPRDGNANGDDADWKSKALGR